MTRTAQEISIKFALDTAERKLVRQLAAIATTEGQIAAFEEILGKK